MIAMVQCLTYMFISQLEKKIFIFGMNYVIFVSYPKTLSNVLYSQRVNLKTCDFPLACIARPKRAI